MKLNRDSKMWTSGPKEDSINKWKLMIFLIGKLLMLLAELKILIKESLVLREMVKEIKCSNKERSFHLSILRTYLMILKYWQENLSINISRIILLLIMLIIFSLMSTKLRRSIKLSLLMKCLLILYCSVKMNLYK